MPLRSLRTRLVALFLVSLAIAAFLFAAVAVRQFSQDERSRARSDLSRQSLQIVRLIEEFAEKRLEGEAGAPADFATSLGGITDANVYFVGRWRPLAADRRGALRQGPQGHGGPAQLDAARQERAARQTLDLKLADGTSSIAAAGGFRFGGQLIGAIVVARPVRTINTSALVQGRRFVPPLLLALRGRGARGPAAEPPHHAPGARADRGERAHRAAATTTCTSPRRAPTSSASSRCASSRWRASSRRRACTSATS